MRDLIRVWFISAVLLAVPQTARQAVVDLRLGSDVTPFVDQTEHSTLRVGSQSSSAAIPSFSGSWTGTGTFAAAWGDVNGDGRLDLLSGSQLYLNIGNRPATQPVWTVPTATYNRGAALGDVDGDGDLDIALANLNGPNEIYLNREGAFGQAPDWSSSVTYDQYRDVLLGDVDNDGDLDLVFSIVSGHSQMYRNDGGVFTDRPVWESEHRDDAWSLALGDLNGDGFLDLAGATLEGDLADTVLSFGSGINPAGDVNGDGLDDLLVSGYEMVEGQYLNRQWLFLGGSSLDAGADLTLGGWTGRINGGDLNADGFSDFVMTDYSSAQIAVHLGSATPDTSADLVLHGINTGGYLSPNGSIGDVNGDGYDDVILQAITAEYTEEVNVYFGGVAPDTVPALVLSEGMGDGFGTIITAEADMNGDGFHDIAVAEPYYGSLGSLMGRVYVYLGGASPDSIADLVITGEPNEFLGRSLDSVGDMNGDGFDDIVVGEYVNNTGRALVVFGAAILNASNYLILTGEAPRDEFGWAVAGAGDMNGDGFQDLAVGAHNSDADVPLGGRTYVYYGGPVPNSIPDVILKSENEFDSDFGINVTGAGDLNGDGFSDLVVGAPQSDAKGDGGGQAYVYLGGSPPSPNAALSLIGADGLPQPGGGHFIYFNQGGTFPTTPSWQSEDRQWGTWVTLGDIDGDGDLDPVFADLFGVGRPKPGNLTIYRNDGGTISSLPIWKSNAHAYQAVSLADVDRDGDLDIFAAYQTVATLSNVSALHFNEIYLNSGGVFSQSPDVTFGGAQALPQAIVPGDMDGDGDVDFCVARISQNILYVNRSEHWLSSTPMWSSGVNNTRGVALGDLDNDGDLDLVFANVGVQTAYYNQGGVIETTSHWPQVFQAEASGVSLGDVDGNGFLDAVFVTDGTILTGQVTQHHLYLNNGGVLSTYPVVSPDAFTTSRAVLADLDSDGKLDLVRPGFSISPCNDLQPNTVAYGLTGTFSYSTAWYSEPQGSRDVAVADLDKDGDLDLAFANACPDHPNTVYLNSGASFPEVPNWSLGYELPSVAVVAGDLSGDQLPDLVFTHGSGYSTAFRNDGNGSWASPPFFSVYSEGIKQTLLGDVDVDGDLDVLLGGPTTPSRLYIIDGQSGFHSGWAESSSYHTQQLALGDMDQDGDLDLVCANEQEPSRIYANLRNQDLDPSRLLPDGPSSIRGLALTRSGHRYAARFKVLDPDSDPVSVVPQYRVGSDGDWTPMTVDGDTGPLTSSPTGVEHMFEWNVASLPITAQNVDIRFLWSPIPKHVSLIRESGIYLYDLGRLPRRPRIGATGPVVFAGVTVGDSIRAVLNVSNLGDGPLTISGVQFSATEFVLEKTPPFVISPQATDSLSILFAPRTLLPPVQQIRILTDDPATPEKQIDLATSVVNLEARVADLGGPAKVPLGRPLTIGVTAVAPSHIEGGYVFYRSTGDSAFADSVALAAIGEAFVATIPGEGVTERGIEYYVRVQNSGLGRNYPDGAPGTVFRRDVEMPNHVEVTPQDNSATGFLSGVAVNVLLSLPTGAVFQEGTLFHRQGGEVDYRSAEFTVRGALIVAAVPDSLVGARGVEYWARVVTASGTVLTTPALDPAPAPLSFQTSVARLVEPSEHRGNDYRILSVPLDFGPDFTGTLATILGDQPEFGIYNPENWRCFAYSESGYDEFDEGSEFIPKPGRAFWLISRTAHRVDTAPIIGFSTPTREPFAISLSPGWNMVGNPYAFPVAWSSVRVNGVPVEDQSDVEPPQSWTGTSYVGDQTLLEPFTGYWIMNRNAAALELEVPAIQGTAPLQETRASAKRAPGSAWTIKITASAGGVHASGEGGVDPEAASGVDAKDRSAPPLSPGHCLSVYFPHGDWMESPGRYATDLRDGRPRPQTEDGQAWRFDVAKSFTDDESGDPTSLAFDVSRMLPDHEAVLFDRDLRRFVDLRQQSSYVFTLPGKDASSDPNRARFELLVGSDAFIETHRLAGTASPFENRLFQNSPNPFRNDTSIRYELAKAERVRIEIFDIQGRLVRSLIDEMQDPGRYETRWDGKDSQGRETGPGIYFYHVEGTSTQSTRRMIRVR